MHVIDYCNDECKCSCTRYLLSNWPIVKDPSLKSKTSHTLFTVTILNNSSSVTVLPILSRITKTKFERVTCPNWINLMVFRLLLFELSTATSQLTKFRISRFLEEVSWGTKRSTVVYSALGRLNLSPFKASRFPQLILSFLVRARLPTRLVLNLW